MGTIIRIKGVTFTNPNLPVVQSPYKGVTDGLIAHYQPHLRDALIQPVAGTEVAATKVGSPSYASAYIRGAKGAGVNSNVVVAGGGITEYTICGVFRRPAGVTGAAQALSVGNTGASAIGFTDNGIRVWAYGTPTGGSSTVVTWSDPHFAALDPLVDPDHWEFVALTCGSSMSTAYVPRVGWSNYRNTISGDYFGQGGGTISSPGASTYMGKIAYDNLNGTNPETGAAVDVAYGTFFGKVLSADEVQQQYEAAAGYCSSMGIEFGA